MLNALWIDIFCPAGQGVVPLDSFYIFKIAISSYDILAQKVELFTVRAFVNLSSVTSPAKLYSTSQNVKLEWYVRK